MKQKSLNVKRAKRRKLISFLINKKINNIYKKFLSNISIINNYNKFAVALSGGPDSMALAFFSKCYAIKNNKEVFFFHVDHGLRSNSSHEAKLLKKRLIPFDINLITLKWIGKKPFSNLQSKARDKRYELLINRLAKMNIKNILFGHTKNDLIENFFIRMMRGSGLEGFVSFNQFITKKKNLNILRPLLKLEKKELKFVVNKVFNFYISDVSNKNPKFKRVRIRELIQNIANEGFDIEKLYLTINNLTSSYETINFYIDKNIKLNSKHLQTNHQYLLNKNFFLQPNEVVFRSLVEILRKISKKYYPPRGKKILNLIDDLKGKKIKKRTLHGCIIEKIQNSVLISPEY